MKPITEFSHPDHGWVWTELELRWINDRIATEVAAEREACAALAEDTASGRDAEAIAEAIRGRSNA